MKHMKQRKITPVISSRTYLSNPTKKHRQLEPREIQQQQSLQRRGNALISNTSSVNYTLLKQRRNLTSASTTSKQERQQGEIQRYTAQTGTYQPLVQNKLEKKCYRKRLHANKTK